MTGCYSYVELGRLDVVENLGIDYQDGKFLVTATTISKKEEEYMYQVYTADGASIQDAIQNIKIQENKKLYIAHLDLLILTPALIEERLEDVINYFLQNSESRNDFSMALVSSLDFLEENSDIRPKEMIQIIEEDLGTTKSIQFEEFLKDLLEKEVTYLPTIEVKDDIVIDSITLIQSNQILNHLSDTECVLYNFVMNAIHQTNFHNTTVLSNQTITHFRKNKIHIMIDAILGQEDLEFGDALEQEILQMFDKYRNLGIDIFRFQRLVNARSMKFYEENKQSLLEKIDFSFDIKGKTDVITGGGILQYEMEES